MDGGKRTEHKTDFKNLDTRIRESQAKLLSGKKHISSQKCYVEITARDVVNLTGIYIVLVIIWYILFFFQIKLKNANFRLAASSGW